MLKRTLARLPRNRVTRRLLTLYPPLVPPGWRTGPPDFVGIGAQRAGSTWWHRTAIEPHPAVAPAQIKEVHYFDRFWNGRVPDEFASEYHRFFPRPEGTIAGEWTPRYIYDHWSLRLLREAAPEARILVILRDPVERFRSGLAMMQRRGTRGRGRIMDEIAGAVSRGAYADQLLRVFDLFPRERVLILQYERCMAEPVEQMNRTHRFLGLERFEQAPDTLVARKRPPLPKPELPAATRAEVTARLHPDVERLAALCPEIDVALWPNFRDLGDGSIPPAD